MAEIDIRTCTMCGTIQHISEFDTGRRQCKSCRKEYKKEHSCSYYIKNKDKIKLRVKRYKKSHRDRYNELSRDYYYKHHEEEKERGRKYRLSHHSERNEYMRNRRRDNINHKITANLRLRLYHTLKDNYKSKTTMELLGCSIDELKQHLESLWQPVMSWDNYGRNGWHIDHIIPCSAFELQYSEEQEVCFHWTNLQPLWEADNIIKSDNIDYINKGGS